MFCLCFSEEIRSSNYIAADPDMTSCIVIDRELVVIVLSLRNTTVSIICFKQNCA